MKSIYLLITSLLLLAGVTFSARADVLVLIHGYMGSAISWEASGINALLEANGWRRGGILAGPQLVTHGGGVSANKSYAVELPSLAPMLVQADYLQAMLQRINGMHPGEPLIIAAHSAGGVVARVVLIRAPLADVKALITVASPHLGTSRAVEALDATDTSWPFSMLEDFFASDRYWAVKSSRGALIDLTPAYPGSFLYWLNAQPHPQIAYFSIVTPGPAGLGDELVPVFSQNMNNVPALAGKSKVVAVAGGHSLNPQVGIALIGILAQIE
jgi:triacylglycerol lipase